MSSTGGAGGETPDFEVEGGGSQQLPQPGVASTPEPASPFDSDASLLTATASGVFDGFDALPLEARIEVLAELAVSVSVDVESAGSLALLDGDEIVRANRTIETAGRCVRSLQLALVGKIEEKNLHVYDGYRSASSMMMHTMRLSKAEGGRRARASRALTALPELREAYAVGEVGSCQVDRLARLYGNIRIRDDVVAYGHRLAKNAATLSYAEFDAQLKEFERLADEDGAHDADDRAHERRDTKLLENYDGTWSLDGQFSSAMGAAMEAILQRFVDAEIEADWVEARERVGDTAVMADLRRTPAQQRCDALFALFQAAASAPADARRPEPLVSIVMTQDDFNAAVRYYICGERGGDLARFETARCSTVDGHTVHARDALAAALTGHVRRVVVDGEGVVIDLGQKRRLFTGSARDAALITQLRCVYASCGVKSRHCQVDHLKPWSEHGKSNQHNAAPLCGFHNRWKNNGFTVNRDEHGCWHTYRPDGTEIT